MNTIQELKAIEERRQSALRELLWVTDLPPHNLGISDRDADALCELGYTDKHEVTIMGKRHYSLSITDKGIEAVGYEPSEVERVRLEAEIERLDSMIVGREAELEEIEADIDEMEIDKHKLEARLGKLLKDGD